MAIDNERAFDETKISDLLKEYYLKLQEDRDLIDKIIDDMDLKRPLISPFEAEGRARILGTLLDARQKTTMGIPKIVDAIARLQGNVLKQKNNEEEEDWFLAAAEMANQLEHGKNGRPELMAGDDVEDLVENAKKEKNETKNSST